MGNQYQQDVLGALPGELAFLSSPGELGQLIAARDWAGTPLGPIAQWPQSLRTAVNLMLNSRHAMWIGWGPDATFLYNDAYIGVLGAAKHPWALGRPAAEVWAEIWDFCGPLAEKVFLRAEATFVDDVQLFMRRGDYLEETWFSFSYSPISDESGRVGGLFCPSTDATSRNLNTRRLATLSQLSASALRQDTVAAACATAARTLADNPSDIPFALLYVREPGGNAAQLQETIHLDRSQELAPHRIVPGGPDAGPFPVAQVFRSGQAAHVAFDPLPGLPPGLAGQPVREALALPLSMPGHAQPVGVLVAGVSPARRLHPEYRTFMELVAGQVSAAIQNANAAEEQRQRAEMLAELDRAKTAFFSNVSHEFRTPLTLMRGPIEDALADAASPLSSVQRDRLELVERNALRLEKLVNTLLDFSRVQAGRMQASYAQVDPAALTADLASGFRSVVEGAGLALDVDCRELQMPAWVDVSMWEKIVLNLLSNAYKFTFEGGIAVALEQRGTEALLTVSDTGIGIADDHLDKVFERFARVEGARSRTHEGSGIGLALVRDLVELHGGRVQVASVAGKGSTFSVVLPLGCAHLDDALVADEPAEPTPNSRSLESFTGEAERWLPGRPAHAYAQAELQFAAPVARVLVVDDNADMRDYLARLLGQQWKVTVAANGAEALAAARHECPDVVVSDVMMPVLDGFGLIAALRADAALHGVPVLLLSARAGEEARIEGLSAGADDYVVKPFAARELITRIESQIMRARIAAVERAHVSRLERIFGKVPAGIAILGGPRHVYEMVNDTYKALAGGRELVGQPIGVALPELAGQGIFELLDQVYASGRAYVGRSRHVQLLRQGVQHDCYFDFVYEPMFDARGSVEGIAVVAFEVTELARARREAEVANRAKDEFLAMLGHELRNPLSPILIALELIRLRGVTGADKELAIIERQAQHLVRLVDDLLDVARIAQGKVELRTERVELARLVAQAVETASPLLEERQHRLRLDVPPAGMAVDADPIRFTQVLTNLLTNAAKYTNTGGAISLRAFTVGGEVVLQVEDNGIGIAPATLPLLFDKFVQERQALDRSRGGLGLGLAIVKSIVLLHGGSVSARSEGEGRGSLFEVRVPACADVTADAVVACGGGPGVASPAGLTVLLVDDNPDVLEAMRAMLQLGGHEVVALSDPAAALRLHESFAPAVAILDIGLPGMSGHELAVELRKRPAFSATHLVALSGYGLAEDHARSEAAGFCAHLVKPVGGAEVAALIESLVSAEPVPG